MFLLRNLRCAPSFMKLPRLGYPKAPFSFTRNLESSKPFENSKIKDDNKRIISALGNNKFGQPTPATHPHLLNEGELMPGITRDEFQTRRETLMFAIMQNVRDTNILQRYADKSQMIIIPSSTKKFMSGKIPFVFRQNSDFLYLTGCMEPDSFLTLYITPNGDVNSTLYMRPSDPHSELWDGPRTGVDNCVEFFGVDEAFSTDQFSKRLHRIMDQEDPIVWFDSKRCELSSICDTVLEHAGYITTTFNPIQFVHAMRLYKSLAEQALMRRTCNIASNAINEVMCESKPGHSEHHLYAMIDYKCRMNGASYLAYPPVVASGENTTTIHYINNTQIIKSGDLVLMDAGCEYASYTSDITRTWPISGEFSEPQKILYDIVSLVQTELIENHLLKEGGETLDKLFDTACFKLGKYLQEAGLVPKEITSDYEYVRAGFKFCPHHVSHYLGMDVHDTPFMSRTMPLLPNMVFTVEPGIYIAKDCLDVPPEFRGIGIRVEDDVLINPNNEIEVLTRNCLKERKELENAFKEKTSQKQ